MDAYENGLVEARVVFANRIKLLVQSVHADTLAFFLTYYANLAAIACEQRAEVLKKAAQKGTVSELMNALDQQSLIECQQAYHMKQDAKWWAHWWCQKQTELCLAQVDIAHESLPAVKAYFGLLQNLMQNPWPSTELAIVYEMQRIQLIYSTSLIKVVMAQLGWPGLRRLSMVRLAAWPPQQPISQTLVATFLDQYPNALAVMVEAGQQTLSTYANFIETCYQLADNKAKQDEWAGAIA